MGKVERFQFALGGMRKPDTFVIYPRCANGDYIAQGSRTIARLSPDTGRGLLNWRGSHAKYFLHLTKLLGAQECVFPQEFVNMVREYAPVAGDLIGSSPSTGPVYLAKT